ncbi:hypothetical protein OQ519_12800 [Pseudomonas lurida]|uniref:hypothetical protein n=1 Tax=Pseudomonas lurida TaxID=244566 RepID=UPI001FD4CA1B|nr:hypothetical protein [Pseudomonas lurida]UZQ77186.1 hypothetical protein OQ519_12800 [Pseudomonas lurida]
MELIDGIDLSMGFKPTARLIEYLSTQPLYALCDEQIRDACHLIDQCVFRIQANGVASYLNSLFIETVRSEESILRCATTPPRYLLADGIRNLTRCQSASDEEAYGAYAMACALKAIESLSDWMQASEQHAVSMNWRILALPWEEFCQEIASEIKPDERIDALENYVAHLEVVTSLISLYDDEITDLASVAIKTATRQKGGVFSGIDRKDDMNERDAAIVKQALSLLGNGMSRRAVTTAVHRWLEREVAKLGNERPDWIPLETTKALTRKRVEAILKQQKVL